MKLKKKKPIAFKDIKMLLEALNWENPMIEKIVKLADQKKATEQHGMLSLLLALSGFLIYRFCLKLARRILSKNGMPEERIDYFLNFSKDLEEI